MNTFKLTSPGINHGYIDNKYGKHGVDNIEGMPSLSIPLQWENIPQGTKSFALIMQDYDAIPVCGFSWIHWIAVIPGTYTSLPEGASQTDSNLIQGTNSWSSALGNLNRGSASYFGGPAPPDKEHTYEFTLYALDIDLKLEKSFHLNELLKSIRGHILGEAFLEGLYPSSL